MRRPLPHPRDNTADFGGGLDTDTSPWNVSPGKVIGAENYEIAQFGGYQDVTGYERYDGRKSPSAEPYVLLGLSDEEAIGSVAEVDPFETVRAIDGHADAAVISGTGAPADTLGSDGNLYLETDDGRTWAKEGGSWGSVANDEVQMVGRYDDGDQVRSIVVAGDLDEMDLRDKTIILTAPDGESRVAEGVFTSNENSVADAKDHALMRRSAANVRRETIGDVPGSGPVRGMWTLDGVRYAVRNNAAADAAVVHKATSGGWEEVSLGQASTRTFAFRQTAVAARALGTTDDPWMSFIQDGVSDGIQDAAVRINSGTWTSGDVYGVMEFPSTSDQIEVANGAATLRAGESGDTVDAAIEVFGTVFDLQPGGKYETVVGNFGYGDRVYGVDGENPAFEFDGATMFQIRTGNDVDKPTHVSWHEFHLFLSFAQSLQHSGIGDPLNWTVIAGAAELAVDRDISALHVEPGESGNAALSVWTENSIAILYGTSSADWNMVDFRKEVGAFPGTVQEIVQTAFVDARGVRYLETVQEFGNFRHATLSEHFQKFFNDLIKGNKPSGSCIIRDKNQYRVFFADGRALYLTFRRERLLGAMPINLERRIGVVHSAEDSDGSERVFFGDGDNGRVYEMERGTSFDGDPINAHIRLHPNYMGRRWHGWIKKYLRAVIQAKGEGYAEFRFSFFARDDLDRARAFSRFNQVAQRVPSFWDTALWDIGRWDEAGIGPTRLDLNGEGENISYILTKSSDYFDALELAGIRTTYVLRRQTR